MKVRDPGHIYELDILDPQEVNPVNVLTFVKREGKNYPGNVGHHAGTNIQEVLRACIDRMKYLHGQIPDDRNVLVLRNLRQALFFLEARAAARHDRHLIIEGNLLEIETLPTCTKCLHIGCKGTCHP